MPTNLQNVSTSITPSLTQIYQVPSGRKAIILSVAIASDGDAKIFIIKQKANGDDITLVPGKVIDNADTYNLKLEKTVLLPGEKLYAKATSPSVSSGTRTTPIFGLPTIYGGGSPLLPTYISLSLAERTE